MAARDWLALFPKVEKVVQLGSLIRGAVKRHRAKKNKQQELQLEDSDMNLNKILEAIAAYSAAKRTSTKAGAAGLVPILVPLVAMVPYWDQINAYALEACKSGEGPAMFVVGGAAVWIVKFVTARLSKTPANPGVL